MVTLLLLVMVPVVNPETSIPLPLILSHLFKIAMKLLSNVFVSDNIIAFPHKPNKS